MTREQLEAAFITSPHAKGRLKQRQRINGLEDYLFIGGDQMSARQVALRLGVATRTVTRWRKALREAP